MINLVTISDFTGDYYLNPNQMDITKRLDAFITDRQLEHLVDLMGVEVYNSFEDDGNGVPTQARYINLLNGERGYTDFYGDKRNYLGLKSFLVPFIFSEWLMNDDFFNTNAGTVKKNQKNSQGYDKVNLYRVSAKRWNTGIKYYNEAFDYMYTNIVSYPCFSDYFKRKDVKGLFVRQTIQ